MNAQQLKTLVSKNKMAFTSALSLVIIYLIFSVWNPNFLSPPNIKNLMIDMSSLLILGAGVTMIIMLGSTDLSIGSVVSLCAVIFAQYEPELGVWIYPVVILIGAFAGFMVGVLHVRFRIPCFIASLGMMSIWESLALIFSGNNTVQLPRKQWFIIQWAKETVGIIPSTFILAVVITLIFGYIIHKTPMGYRVFSIGANERCADISGVNITRTKLLVFLLAGITYAIAAITFVAKLHNGAPKLADDSTLTTIAAIALGGTALSGGKGSMLGTFLGVMLVATINNGMTVGGVDSFWQKILFGTIVVGTAILTARDSHSATAVK